MAIEVVYGLAPAHADAQDWALLDSHERQRAGRISQPEARGRYIALHALTRRVLARRLGLPPATLRIDRGRHGKPSLLGQPLFYNLSHSHQYFALALSDEGEVGVDLESYHRRRTLHLSRLARRCFATAELEYWQKQPEHRREEVFLQFWTLKEALVKAAGLGIQAGLQHCQFDLTAPPHPVAIPDVMRGQPAAWCWWQQKISPGLLISVVYPAQQGSAG
ncbi:MAG: 4'-phosphopantetheinyl transferase superfamily protein [Methylococcales bacterium]|nr:4'-phosphopantetheinyl transferase superfamily protein [Methylococcales bacterium]